MANVGDWVEVASRKGAPRTGRVIRTSGMMVTIAWDNGEESSLLPGPGTLSVVKRGRPPAPSKVTKTRVPARAAQKPAIRKATGERATATPSKTTAKKGGAKKTLTRGKAVFKAAGPVKKTAPPAKKSNPKKAVPVKKTARKAAGKSTKKASAKKRR